MTSSRKADRRGYENYRSVSFGPEADGFTDVLRILCTQSLAVTLTLRTGTEFGAVLVSAENGMLIYEHWDDESGLPSGEPATVEIVEIAEVRVF
ncbi:MAG: hypothetical protein ACYDEP_12040 [Acidimicrobiales bacterium]